MRFSASEVALAVSALLVAGAAAPSEATRLLPQGEASSLSHRIRSPSVGRLLQTAEGGDAAAALEAGLAAFRAAAAHLSAAYTSAGVTTLSLPKALIEARGQVSHALGQAQEELESIRASVSGAGVDLAAISRIVEQQLQQLADELDAAVASLTSSAHGPQLDEVKTDLIDQLTAVENATDAVSGTLATAADSTEGSGGSGISERIEAVLDRIRDLLVGLVPGSGGFAAGDSTSTGSGSTAAGGSAADLDRLLSQAVSLTEAKLEKLRGIGNVTTADTEAAGTEAPTPSNPEIGVQASATNKGSDGSSSGFSRTTGMLG